MGKTISRMRGFTLIASLLLLVLLSGVAIGLMFLVNSQQHVGSNDMEDNLAFYGAESGMEKLTSDLSALYSSTQAPTAAQLANLANFPPTAAEVGAMAYVITPPTQQVDNAGNPVSRFSSISAGPEQGLSALTIPINLQVQATRPSGASVNMLRTVEIALIPVFQFGVFSDSDLSYFAGPHFGFEGRIHTNGNLFLAANAGPLVADAKITAFGQVIRDRLANDFNAGGQYNGSVFIPNQTGACAPYIPNGSPNPPAGSHCIDFGADANNATNNASWSGGIPPAGVANPAFPGDATFVATGFVETGATGAKKLTLPFVQGNNPLLGTAAQQIAIIRKGLSTDSVSVANSKLYNKAAIRILLADTEAGLVQDGRNLIGDPDDIDLTGGGALNGYQVQMPGAPLPAVQWTHVAMAQAGGADPAWTAPPLAPGLTHPNPGAGNPKTWNLVNGWIRVEYLDTAAPTPGWHGITRQWLGYGIGRGVASLPPPTAPGTNPAHPNAILVLQEMKNAGVQKYDTGSGNAASELSWYPINFWDPREGLPRDNAGALTGTQCNVNGVMNAIELDVGNLNHWLQGAAPYGAGSGPSVNSTAQNGYVLYFSDRRGMEIDTKVVPNAINGEYGFEDVVNSAAGAANGPPNQTLEPSTPGYNVDVSNGVAYSPEDSDENGLLDNWGAADVGNGFGVPTTTNPYVTTNCATVATQNIVTGARHVLKLVDGAIGNLPTAPGGAGGFTVASENPVYIAGNYNSDAADTVWNTGNDDARPHAAASIVADAVSLMSNQWTDQISMLNTLNLGGRVPNATYFRTAIAAGKSMNFPTIDPAKPDFGTDGGVHNYLRLLENWPGFNLYYRGSLVSLFYSEYATGTFKCCTEVYNAPFRNFSFDTDFQNPNNLPPGTPMLQDINNLTEHQNFTPQ